MRITAFIMSLYLLVISLGVHLSFHFHEDQLTCFSLIGSDEFCCHKTFHPKDDSCQKVPCEDEDCHIEYLNITLEDDFLMKSSNYSSEYVIQLAQGIHQPPLVIPSAVEFIPKRANAPPHTPIYLENSSLLFYG